MVDAYWDAAELPTSDALKQDDDIIADFMTVKDDNSRSWKTIAEKTYKKCELDGEKQPDDVEGDQAVASKDNWKFVSCERINAHFYRDFVTVGDDLMLDAHDTTKYSVIGFQRDHEKANFSDETAYNWGSLIKNFQPVTAAFKEEIETNDGNGSVNANDGTKEEEDGAIHNGVAYAAIFIATLSTLCF